MTIADNLRAAKALIENPKDWCRFTYTDGDRYCMLGALNKVVRLGNTGFGPEEHLLQRARDQLFDSIPLPDINDSLGHPAVMAVYSRAIELAEAEDASR